MLHTRTVCLSAIDGLSYPTEGSEQSCHFSSFGGAARGKLITPSPFYGAKLEGKTTRKLV